MLPPVACLWWVTQALIVMSPWAYAAASALVLYLAIGLRSLGEHARAVARALVANDLAMARAAVGCMVSRDVASLDRQQVAAAATESVLENGSDAVFAALFWFVLRARRAWCSIVWPTRSMRCGAIARRAIERFGWAAARIDDVLNYVPARLDALTYALLGKTRTGRSLLAHAGAAVGQPQRRAGDGGRCRRAGRGAGWAGAAITASGEPSAAGRRRAPMPRPIVRGCALVVRRGVWLSAGVACRICVGGPAPCLSTAAGCAAARDYGIPPSDWLDLSTGHQPVAVAGARPAARAVASLAGRRRRSAEAAARSITDAVAVAAGGRLAGGDPGAAAFASALAGRCVVAVLRRTRRSLGAHGHRGDAGIGR